MINLSIFLKKLHFSMIKAKIYKSLITILTFIFLCSTFFYYFEVNYNSKIKTIKDALWWGFVTSTTVGYGDIFPVTMGGRIIAILLMILGVGVFGFITASFASLLVEKNLKKGMGVVDVKYKNHIIIVGWNLRSKLIIDELINEDIDFKITIIDKIDHNPYNRNNISYIKGDAWDETVLKRANLNYAKTIIVLADKKIGNEEMIDAKSVLICLAIDRLNPNIYVIAEVMKPNNKVHFKRVNADDVIISDEIESKILMRSAIYSGVNKTYKELITNKYGCEIYETIINNKYVNMKYGKVANLLMKNKITLIGFCRHNNLYLTPSVDTTLEKDDILIYIAEKKYI